jgi:hypothetical protein
MVGKMAAQTVDEKVFRTAAVMADRLATRLEYLWVVQRATRLVDRMVSNLAVETADKKAVWKVLM